MQIRHVQLFHWLLSNYKMAKYVLSFSNSFPIDYKEFKEITNFSIPESFILSYNDEGLSTKFKNILADSYHCPLKNVVLTNGGTESNFLVFLSQLERNDEFIVEQPGYSPLWNTPEVLGAKKIVWDRTYEDQFQPSIDKLQKIITKKTKLIVLTNLHNPSGVQIKNEYIKAISEIAEQHNSYVLIDEIFLDGTYQSNKSSFGLPNVIITSSVTKIYGLGGMRIGWIIAPQSIAENCQNAKAHTNASISDLSTLIAIKALGEYKEIFRKRFLEKSKRNHILIKNWINQNNTFLEYIEPNGGIICFPKYHHQISSYDLCKYLLEKERVLVCPGSLFNKENHFRISSNIEQGILINGLNAIENGLKDMIKK